MKCTKIFPKKILCSLICVPMLFSYPAYGVFSDGGREANDVPIGLSDTQRAVWGDIEAESGVIAGAVQIMPGYSWASGGTKVGWLGGGEENSLTIMVTPPAISTATLTVRYCAGENRELRLRVNGGNELLFSDLNSGGWSTAANFELPLTLNPNVENSIKLYSQTSGVDLDKFTFTVGNLPPAPIDGFPANPIDKPGYRLIFGDEFSGDALDPNVWVEEYLPSWTKTPERAVPGYVMQDGIMSLRITPETQPWCPEYDGQTVVSGFTSANRNAFHNWTGSNTVRNPVEKKVTNLTQYGYFEMRAKAQLGSSHHVAWWLTGFEDIPRESSELDIFEILGKDPQRVMITNHPWKDTSVTYATTNPYFADKNFTEEFHVFGLKWEEVPYAGKVGKMTFYLDNKPIWTIGSNISYPMASLISLYEKRGGGWTGPFDPSIPYPKKFDIDYLRIYKEIPAGYEAVAQGELAIKTIEAPTMELTKGNYAFAQYTSQVAGSEGTVYTSTELTGQPSYVQVFFNDGTDTHQWVKWDEFTEQEKGILDSGGQFVKYGEIQGLPADMPGLERAALTVRVGKPAASNVSTTISTNTQYPIENIFDGAATESSKWISTSMTAVPANATITFKLDAMSTVSAMNFSTNYGQKQGITVFDLEYLDDATGSWVAEEKHKGYRIPWTAGGNADSGETVQLSLSEPIGATTFRLKVTGAPLTWSQIVMREIQFLDAAH